MAVELLSVARPTPKRVSEPASASAPEVQPSYIPTSEYAQPAPSVDDHVVQPQFSGTDKLAASYAAPEVTAVEEAATPVVEHPEAVGEPVHVEATPSFEQSSPAVEESSAWRSETPVAAELVTSAPLPGRRRYGQEAELPVDVSTDEERRLHNDARRFARLLISEIKLYNEQKVAEGRSEHDLYDRLREYIDRSREMYDKRVKPEVASRYDYFHGELVNTLAEGDAAKLGSNYPGATVTA